MLFSVCVFQGFQVLIEREWLQFGHKFADRCGNGLHTEDLNERCPVFLQWLECVYQLIVQFPCLFEFNEAFLVSTLWQVDMFSGVVFFSSNSWSIGHMVCEKI